VLDEMNVSDAELAESVRLYEKYLRGMALLRVQRRNMLAQLARAYDQPDGAWAEQLARSDLQQRNWLAASASMEALQIWQRKETELYCELLEGVVVDVRFRYAFGLHASGVSKRNSP
jgi:hypothetical protein